MLKILFLISLFMFLPGVVFSTTIYKFVDKNGVVHFSDIPPSNDAGVVRVITHLKTKKRKVSSYSIKMYKRLAEAAARRYSLDPELVKSVIEKESHWNPRAVSRRGAMGLMQLMPSTARALGVIDPFDPRENIDAGVRYLKSLIDRFGDLKKALAAYNAGPTVVKRYGGVPPYFETRNYVKDILYRYNGGSYIQGRGYNKEKIYRIVLDDGTVVFTNSPFYLQGLSSF